MTHDPLCPISKYPNNYPRCACDVIARVRGDTIAAAVQRVEAMTPAIYTPIGHPHEGRGYADAIAECILLGYRHIDRINEEAEAAISEQVANQLYMNADGIEFFVSKLRALQTLREEKK